MTQPINLQVNILGAAEQPQRAQESKNVEANTQMAQATASAEESEIQTTQVQSDNQAQDAELSKDGSGRGRGFLRQRKKDAKPEDEKASDWTDPTVGSKVDLLR